jgi:hypothetical protein
MGFQRVSSLVRSGLVLMAALALLVRALVPTGMMPAVTDQGITLVICSGMESRVVTLDASGAVVDPAKPSPAPASAPDEPCAFAGLGWALDAAPLVLVLVAIAYVLAASTRPQRARVPGFTARLRPPATAPPAAQPA